MLKSKITIDQSEELGWSVEYGEKSVNHLTFDEMLGLVASITMPEPRPCSGWLKTDAERKAQEELFNTMPNKVEPEILDVPFEEEETFCCHGCGHHLPMSQHAVDGYCFSCPPF